MWVWQADGDGGGTLALVIVRRVLGWVGLGSAPEVKDIEIAVLRHQLMMVRRQVARPRYAPSARFGVATWARLPPRERWQAFLVTPGTLLRWHRELVTRRWTYRHIGRARQGVDRDVIDLVVRMARENPRWGYVRRLRCIARSVDTLRRHARTGRRGCGGGCGGGGCGGG
jgi:putative transposase